LRRSLLAILASSVALIGVVPAANAQTGDSVTGQAQFRPAMGTLVFDFSFDAHSGPSGEQPSGTVNGAAVTCLNVSGNEAIIGTTANSGQTNAVLFVEDNDGAGQDRVGVEPFFPAPLTVCPDPDIVTGPLTFGPFRITSGDIVVVDAPPLPTSREQCKNGGWRNFGTAFRNQGQCVAFVERHPQP
jgi:hypothetical protein